MIEAARDVACIFVDCNWGKNNQEIAGKFGVKSYPTVIFCDPQGNSLGRLTVQDPDGVAAALKDLGDNVGAKAAVPVLMIDGTGYDVGLASARRKGRPLLVYVADRAPPSLTMNQSLADGVLADVLTKYSTAKEDFVKGSPTCLKLGVTRAPTILVLDSRLAKPEEKPIAKIEGSRSPRELRRELEAALVGRDPGGKPEVGQPGELPSVRRDPPPPQEKLSDDVIERQFIWARVAVAQETLKRGSKDKAIEILEDVLKSYPKHKDTEEVRKVLEAMRK